MVGMYVVMVVRWPAASVVTKVEATDVTRVVGTVIDLVEDWPTET